MTGRQFEDYMCETLADCGYWVHRLAANEGGAQPFDIIALGYDEYITADCKVCSKNYFPFERIEENQRYAFEMLSGVAPSAFNGKIGIFAWCDDNIYWIPFKMILECEKDGKKGVRLSEDLLW